MIQSENQAKPKRSATGAVASSVKAKATSKSNVKTSPALKRKKSVASELTELNSAQPIAPTAKALSPKAAARAAVATQMPEKLGDVAEVVESPIIDEVEAVEPEMAEVAEVEAVTEPEQPTEPEFYVLAEGEVATSFHQLPISKPMLDVLDERGFQTPTPIQAQAIPVIASGVDLLVSRKPAPAKRSPSVCPSWSASSPANPRAARSCCSRPANSRCKSKRRFKTLEANSICALPFS